MAKYQLKVYGWELNASAQSLTDQQVEDIKQYQEENGYDDLSEIAWELETIVDGYEPFSTNMWVIDVPMDNDRLSFILEDENGQEVSTFDLDGMTDHYEIVEDYEGRNLNGYPTEGEEQNILLFLEENKGIVYGFNFESEEVPTAKDFSYIRGSIETPDGDWDFVDKVFFKGTELEVDYDFQGTNGKALTVQLWTLNDVN
jgi:hypothetical protein